MKNYKINLLLMDMGYIFICSICQAQSFSPSVVSTSGAYYQNSGYSLSSTTGQLADKTQTSGNYIFTQGFQQPGDEGMVIAGKIATETGTPIPTVTLHLTGDATLSDLTASNGLYLFSVEAGGDYTVTPAKSNDSITNNGITTLDILMIQRHILNIQSLSSPYKIIAADVNTSYTVSTLDIVLMRAVILAVSNTFPNNALWAFVPHNHVFSNPLAPFPFPRNRTYSNLTESQINQDFIGIKLGDVNNSWNPAIPKHSAIGNMQMAINEQHAMPEDEIIVPIRVKDFQNITGYQFTLSWDASVLSLLEVSNKALQGYYGEQRKDEGYLTTTWYDEMAKAITLDDDAVAFELKFKVIGANGSFSPITIGSELTTSEAYNENLDLLNIVPQNGMVKVGDGSNRFHPSQGWNLSVQPNPFTNTTNIIFTIPQDETVSIEIYDLLGRQVKSVQSNYQAGEHAIEWSGDNDAGVPLIKGLYHIRMTAGGHLEGTKVLLWTE